MSTILATASTLDAIGKMRLTFSWDEDTGTPSPRCESDSVNRDGVSLLACFLMDDGGCGNGQSINWIDEGLRRIGLIQNDAETSNDWCRETWGSRLTINEAVIFSLHDESYFQTISLNQFKYALLAWKDFLWLAPSPEQTYSIDI